MALTQLEAKRAILDEWRVWPKEYEGNTTHDMTAFFFSWLPNHKPHLLKFKCSGNHHWHVVKGWLQDYQRSNRN